MMDKIKVGDYVGDIEHNNVFEVKFISGNIMLLERVKKFGKGRTKNGNTR